MALLEGIEMTIDTTSRTEPAAAASLPTSDPALYVLIGVAGAGKSTFAGHWRSNQILSLDAFRGWVSDDDCDQEATNDAVIVMHTVLAARMRRHLTTVVDATNVTADARRPLVELAAANGVPAVAIVVDTPLPLCHDRNDGRPGPVGSARWGRRVPADIVNAQHRELRLGLPGLRSEGFAATHIHRPGGETAGSR
jgi:predicted kinase